MQNGKFIQEQPGLGVGWPLGPTGRVAPIVLPGGKLIGLGALTDATRPEDFGAVGDGVADDSAALQALFASSESSVYLPAGTYRVSGVGSILELASGKRVFGDGMGRSIISVAFDDANTGNAVSISASGVVFENWTLAVNGQDTDQSAVRFESSGSGHRFTNFEIDGAASFDGTYTNEIQGFTFDDAVSVTDVVMHGCKIHDVHYGLFTSNTYAGDANDWTFIGCAFYNNTADDLEFNVSNSSTQHWSRVRVTGCSFYDWKGDPALASGGFAIGIDSGQEITISQCHFNGYPIQAVHVEDYCRNVSIVDNTFEDCAKSVVVFHSNSSQIMVANNRISGALAETVESDPSAYDDPPADIDDNVIGVYCINSGATDSPIGVIVANNQISLCDVGVYAPVKRGGQAYGNTIFNCIVGIATSGTANGSARIRGNRLYLCKYAFWAPAAILGRNAIEDCTNIVYGRTGALVFLDGFVFRKQATNIAAGTTVDWPIMAVTRIANGKISAHARYSTNWAVGGISASYDGTTLTTNRDNYIASGIIAISSTPSVVTTGTFGLRIQNAGGAAYDVEVEAEASGTFVMS